MHGTYTASVQTRAMPNEADGPERMRPLPSYAQPRHLHRRQPPLLERVRDFVATFGSVAQSSKSSDYYVDMCIAMSKGLTGEGAATAGTVRRRKEERDALQQQKRPVKSSASRAGGSGSTSSSMKQLRERMHRATQGLTMQPLPSALLQQFAAKDPVLEPPADKAEYDALTWLGLLRVKRCGLCGVEFPLDALVTSVSIKAIRNLREEWALARGVPITTTDAEDLSPSPPQDFHSVPQHPFSSSSKKKKTVDTATWIYSSTRVCRYCSQFFGVFLGSRFEESGAVVGSPTAPLRKQTAPHRPGRKPQRTPLKRSSAADIDECASSCSQSESDGSSRSRDSSRSSKSSRSARSSNSSQSGTDASSTCSKQDATRRKNTTNPTAKHTIRVRALEQQPFRPVIATRSSLLRRTHHSAKQAACEVASPPSQEKLNFVPVAQRFVLGPSDDESSSAPASQGQSPRHPQTKESSSAPAQQRHSPKSRIIEQASSPHADARSTAVPLHFAAAHWSGEVRILVVCCHAYSDQIALPLAAADIARRFAHWCEQFFFSTSAFVNRMNDDDFVTMLVNDEATLPAVAAFVEACGRRRAAPLIAFVGLAGPASEDFSDISLCLTNKATSWPAKYDKVLRSQPGSGDHVLRDSARDTFKRPTSAPAVRLPKRMQDIAKTRQHAAMTNPLAHGAAGTERKHTLGALSVRCLDTVCAAHDVPMPLLVVDSCFGPLVTSTTRLTLVHPSRGVAPASHHDSSTEVPAISCGAVLRGFAAFANSCAVDEGKAGWSDLMRHLCNERGGDVGVVAQELFREHLNEDAALRPFVVSSPSSRQHLFDDTSDCASHSGSGFKPTLELSIITLPAGVRLVEMHTLDRRMTSLKSPRGVALIDEADDVISRAVQETSQSFAIRLHPQHTVSRVSTLAQKQALGGCLQQVLRGAGSLIPMEELCFNMMLSLSGHVTVVISVPHSAVLQEVGKLLSKSTKALEGQGWRTMDCGFVVASPQILDAKTELSVQRVLGGVNGVVVLDAVSS